MKEDPPCMPKRRKEGRKREGREEGHKKMNKLNIHHEPTKISSKIHMLKEGNWRKPRKVLR